MFCPRCRGEFVEGVVSCPDCEVRLRAHVAAPPATRPALAPLHWRWGRRGRSGLGGGAAVKVPVAIVVVSVVVAQYLVRLGGWNLVNAAVVVALGLLAIASWIRWLRRPVSRASQRRVDRYVASGAWGVPERVRRRAARRYSRGVFELPEDDRS